MPSSLFAQSLTVGQFVTVTFQLSRCRSRRTGVHRAHVSSHILWELSRNYDPYGWRLNSASIQCSDLIRQSCDLRLGIEERGGDPHHSRAL